MKIKTTMRYYLTPVKMAAAKKTRDNKCWHGCGEKRTTVHSWWENELIQPVWKIIWRFLKKLKGELSNRTSNPTSGYLSKRIEIRIPQNISTPTFIAPLFTVAERWKPPQPP